MSALKLLYPQANQDSVPVTITLASLATSSTLLAGRESNLIDNTSNLDLDHLLAGVIKLGTSPTASTSIEVWAYTPYKSASGTKSYPAISGTGTYFTGVDAAATFGSANIKASGALRLVASMTADATTGLNLSFSGVSVKSLFGSMPPWYGIFVTHSTAVALDATPANHYIGYQRVQAQSV